eukprot:g2067.t1
MKRNRFISRQHVSICSLGLVCSVALLTYSISFRWTSAALSVIFQSRASEDLRASAILKEGGNLPSLLKVSSAQLVHEHFEAQRLHCLREVQSVLHNLLQPFIEGRESKLVLMDVAIHANLGDNILWKAATNLITHFGISPKILCYSVQPSWLEEIDSKFPKCNLDEIVSTVSGGGTVLLHGGGNWGDLYRFVHEGRMNYLETLTGASIAHNFTIVQLPQSISYSSFTSYMYQDDRALNQMDTSKLILFTRQEDSYVFAKRHYPRVDTRLSPDIAYALGPILPSRKPEFDVVIQMRQDKEVIKSDENLYDWIQDQFRNANMTFDYRDWWYHPDEHSGELSQLTPSLLGDVRLQAAVDMISTGKILITNRLHGSIISALLGRYTFIVDTVEGKLGKVNHVMSLMTSSCSARNLHRATCGSLREAVLSAVELYQSWNGEDFYY